MTNQEFIDILRDRGLTPKTKPRNIDTRYSQVWDPLHPGIGIEDVIQKGIKEMANGYRTMMSIIDEEPIYPKIAYNACYGHTRGGIFNIFSEHAIKKVIFNEPATIIMWADGTKTVVKCKDEPFDPEKGMAMAIAKKAFGNKGNYYNHFTKWLPKPKEVTFNIGDVLQKAIDDLNEAASNANISPLAKAMIDTLNKKG